MADGSLYFAYGSNINLGQMAYRCPDTAVMGPVTLEGWELLFHRNRDECPLFIKNARADAV